MRKDIDKYNLELNDKTQNIYGNLCVQIEKVFRHCNQGAYKTRERYEDGVKNFGKFMADAFKKQNLNNIKPKHLFAYVEFMQDMDTLQVMLPLIYQPLDFFMIRLEMIVAN